MAYVEKIAISDSKVISSLRPIKVSGPYESFEKAGFRDIESDVQQYNAIVENAQSITDILRPSADFLHRLFGDLKTQEIYVQICPDKEPELIVKSRCRCGNMVSAPLKSLVEGSLSNCGCKTPLPEEYTESISVYPSEAPTSATTTVDGIQWLGSRYMWFVTLFVRGVCMVREYTDDTREALRIRCEAEKQYYGGSNIEKYEDLMYAELEQFRNRYVARHPPKVEGIYNINGMWNARLWYCHKFVLNKTFHRRIDAVKARLKAEKRYLGAPIMAERYYV